MKYQDLTGNKYGKLTAIEPVNEKGGRGQHKKWICKCECGNTTIVTSDHLKKGNTTSCGCYHHGLSNTRLYRIWKDMRSRCSNEKEAAFKYYGRRGIIVCDEWENSFKAFYDWAIKNGYDERLTIDRINNDKGYSPKNCRWISQKAQANNTRGNHRVQYNGHNHTISEWSEITGIKANTILCRIRRGWSVERALTEGVKR